MKKANLPFWQNPRFRYGSVSTLLLCAALAVLVALNGLFTTLEKKHGWRVDYSFNAFATYGEETEAILSSLPYPVHIYALYEKGDEDLQLLELLDRYAAASDKVTWELSSLSLSAPLLNRFSGSTSDHAITADCLIVYCAATDRFRVISPESLISLSIDYNSGAYAIAGLTYESELTSAIAYVTQEVIPVVYVAQGHDELDANTSAVFSDLLLGNHYDVRYTSIGNMALTPDDLLVFLAPVRDLSDNEMKTVTDFAAAGGSILFACDYSDPVRNMPNYQALLRSYGFIPLEGVVIASREEPATYYESNRTILLPDMQPADVTLDMMLSGAGTLLMSTPRAFEMPEVTDVNLTVAPILLSGEKAYLRSISTTSTSLEKQPEDPEGPFALALQSRRFSSEGNVSRAVMLGSSTMLTSSTFHAMSHSQEFIIRIMEFLLDGAGGGTTIMSKLAMRPQLSAESVTIGCLMLVALPLSVLLAAFLILYPRRHL